MGNVLSRIFGPEDIVSGASTVYTVPGGHKVSIKEISIVNNTGFPITVKIGINGITDASLILPSIPIPEGGFAEYTGLKVLDAGDTIHASAGSDGLTITANGIDQS